MELNEEKLSAMREELNQKGIKPRQHRKLTAKANKWSKSKWATKRRTGEEMKKILEKHKPTKD